MLKTMDMNEVLEVVREILEVNKGKETITIILSKEISIEFPSYSNAYPLQEIFDIAKKHSLNARFLDDRRIEFYRGS